MKQLLLSLFFFSLSVQLFAQFRPQEKEVHVKFNSAEEVQQLQALHLKGEYFREKAVFNLVPKEIEQLESMGLEYKITIDDLASHYAGFWAREDAYHSYEEIIDLADSLATHFPDICVKKQFGTSVQNRQLVALKISDNAATDEAEAEIMFDAGIHGNEIGGPENVIRFARHLCLSYGNDAALTDLIDNREIWLYLMVNPDGRVHNQRENANGVDVNRDWGYMWDAWGGSPGAYSQPETKALRTCMLDNQFVVHTTYHSGTEYISCPWSYRSSTPPDNDHIIQLAGVYSSTSGYSNLEYAQGNTGMYAINGSSKDSNYGIMGAISWSMEISYDKEPPASQIQHYYDINEPAMIAMIEHAGYGVEGTLTDAVTGEPVQGQVFVNDYMPCFADAQGGDYHKYVLPGTYSITVVANGYQTQTIDNVVVSENMAATTDFALQPQEGHHIFRIIGSQIPGNNDQDEGNTNALFGAPDQINYSIGKAGWLIVDMQTAVLDGPGIDLIVHEGDNTPESFTLYAGESPDGPWTTVGQGTGTTEFDLADASVSETRYLKLLDDGDGQAQVNDAGFDLDAIEALAPESGAYLSVKEIIINDSEGNNNQQWDPGESISIEITIRNAGDMAAIGTTALLSSTSEYVSLFTYFANLNQVSPGQNETAHFIVSSSPITPAGTMAAFELLFEANDGAYSSQCNFELNIGQPNVLVVDLDANNNSAPQMIQALETVGFPADLESSLPAEIDNYQAVFVCLGIYNQNHTLSSSEGNQLAEYLNNGGNLYMEGGDTWASDAATAVHPMFKINGISDGNGDLSTLEGENGTFADGLALEYTGDNSYIDRIQAISPATNLFSNASPAYVSAVANDAGTYKTIGTSFEFGGIPDTGAPNTPEEYMQRITEYFGLTAGTQGTLIGQVSDTDGNPIENAGIYCISLAATTDATGNYQTDFPTGAYTISCQAEGYATQYKPLQIQSGQTITVDFQLPSQQDCTLEGRITDAYTNEALTGVTISIDGIGQTETGNTGEYTLSPVPMGQWLLHITKTGYVPIYEWIGVNDPMTSHNAAMDIVTQLQKVQTPEDQIRIYPNPAHENTQICCTLQQAGTLRLEIWNLQGQLLAVPAEGHFTAGTHNFQLKTSHFSKTGTYLCVLKTESGKKIKKLILIN